MKEISHDYQMRTSQATVDLFDRATGELKNLKAGQELNQEDALKLVHQLDLLAVMLPDNFHHSWDSDLAQEASKLRSVYHKKFGERAYKY